MSEESVTEQELLLRKVRDMQERRVMLYKSWDVAFKKYVEDNNFIEYKTVIQKTIEGFNEVSKGIIELEERLQVGGWEKQSIQVHNLQEAEKEKLKLTSEFQMIKEKLHKLEEDDEDIPVVERECTISNNSIKEVEERINDICEKIKYMAYGME